MCIRGCFFILMLVMFSVCTTLEAQYDLDGNGVDEIVKLQVDAQSGGFQWHGVSLDSNTTTDLGWFGQKGDFPLFGYWSKENEPSSAVLRRVLANEYQLLNSAENSSEAIKNLSMKHLAVLSGDIDGDKLTDIVFTNSGNNELLWTAISSPFMSENSRVRKFFFGPANGTPFLFQWRAKYKSFAVLSSTKVENRALQIHHCFKGCKWKRTIRIPRLLLNGFDLQYVTGVANDKERDLFLFESQNPEGTRLLAINRFGKIERDFSFSEQGSIATGRFFSSSDSEAVVLLSGSELKSFWLDSEHIQHEEVASQSEGGCLLQGIRGLQLNAYFDNAAQLKACYFNSSSPSFTKTETPSPLVTEVPSPSAPVTTIIPTNTATVTSSNSVSPIPTATVTFTQTATNTGLSTVTPTQSFTNTPTFTPTATSTHTATSTATSTATPTPSFSNTPTLTPTLAPTATSTYTVTSTATSTQTYTNTPTLTPTFTPTATFTHTATNTATSTATSTQTLTNTPTLTPTYTHTATNTPAATSTATPSSYTIFMTSTLYTGSSGGVSGIDSICNTRAAAAGRGTGWKVLISTSTVDAKDRVSITNQVYNTNSQLLANNGADLWDGTIAASAFYDEFGNVNGDDIWTGSGSGSGVYDGLDCNAWTTDSSGVSGLVSFYGNWFWGEDGGCDQNHHFYCIKGF